MNLEESIILSKAQKMSRWNAQKIYYHMGKMHQRRWTVKRGEVYFVDLGENIGSEENKIRPVVVLQSNAYNFKAPVFIAAIISSSECTIPDVQVPITERFYYYNEKHEKKPLVGTIDLGQIKTIAKERIVSKKVCLLKEDMKEVDKKLLNVLGFGGILKMKENTIHSLNGKVEYMKEKLQRVQL